MAGDASQRLPPDHLHYCARRNSIRDRAAATWEAPDGTGRQGASDFNVVSCEPIPERAAGFYAAVKITRQRNGLSLDEGDLWIAATALAPSVSHDEQGRLEEERNRLTLVLQRSMKQLVATGRPKLL